jgi:hypothetical protein
MGEYYGPRALWRYELEILLGKQWQMGKFTVLDDPLVDETIEAHMQQIVAAIRARMEPQAILLRGSFGRGEGSVMIQDGQLHFLSDYEIDVAVFSPRYRSFFAELSHRLTVELGVESGIRWVRPDFTYKNRVGPFPMGPAPITISLYESRYGSQTLYGQDIVEPSPRIDPCDIRNESGAFLVLNRMAESLSYMSQAESYVGEPLVTYYWINKTILSCAESLLLLWSQYHFSYAERGRRFAAMAEDHLDFMGEERAVLSELVARATEFKLRPRLDLYAESVHAAWLRLIPICDGVFRHVAMRTFDLGFVHYSEFPQRFLQRATDAYRTLPPFHRGALVLLNLYKSLRVGRLPRALLSPFAISQTVYAVVPLIFVSWAAGDDTLRELLPEVRRHLATVCRIEEPVSNLRMEWDALRQQVLWAWMNYCYR